MYKYIYKYISAIYLPGLHGESENFFPDVTFTISLWFVTTQQFDLDFNQECFSFLFTTYFW